MTLTIRGRHIIYFQNTTLLQLSINVEPHAKVLLKFPKKEVDFLFCCTCRRYILCIFFTPSSLNKVDYTTAPSEEVQSCGRCGETPEGFLKTSPKRPESEAQQSRDQRGSAQSCLAEQNGCSSVPLRLHGLQRGGQASLPLSEETRADSQNLDGNATGSQGEQIISHWLPV